MTIYHYIAIVLVIFAMASDLVCLRKRVSDLELKVMRKVDKPPEETPMERFQRERGERATRLEKEEVEQNKITHS